MSELEHPLVVVNYLRDASKLLSLAHNFGGEKEDERTNLIGPVRDIIFGLNSSVDALADLIEEQVHE